MTRRIVGWGGALGGLAAVVTVMTAPASGQGRANAAPPLVITAYNGGDPIPYVVPRTPWGDPDLQDRKSVV